MNSEGNTQSAPSSGPATVIVRGEAVREADNEEPSRRSEAKDEVSKAKARMRSQLPRLDDDVDVGVEKEQLVVRDDAADLRFTGTLLASAAPDTLTEDCWWEYRVYDTTGGKHVFSKVAHYLAANKPDHHEADVFDPDPSSVPTKLMRSARDLTRSRPVQWTDAAVHFFGYNSLAKALYRKLGTQFDEHIS